MKPGDGPEFWGEAVGAWPDGAAKRDSPRGPS